MTKINPERDNSQESSMQEKTQGVSRRDVLKAAVVGAAALAIGGGLAFNEMPKKENRPFGEIVGHDGHTYVPIYEIHEYGISPEMIPTDLDGLFRESAHLHWNYIFADGFEKYIRAWFPFHGLVDNKEFIPKNIVDHLAKNNIPVILGDLYGIETQDGFLPALIAEGVVGVGAIGGLFLKVRQEKARVESENAEDKPDLQDSLIKSALVGAAGYFTSEILEGLPYLGFTVDNPTVKRIVARLSAAHQLTHAEMPHLLLRDAFMALMMMTAADGLSEAKNNEGQKIKQKIGFWTHADHSGIEDFLRIGQDACRLVIRAYLNNIPGLMDFYMSHSTQGIDRGTHLSPVDQQLKYFSSALIINLNQTGDPYKNLKGMAIPNVHLYQDVYEKQYGTKSTQVPTITPVS